MQAQRPGDILVVDGNAADRAHIVSILEGFGHQVVSLGLGAQAREQMALQPFDVVLCARKLPDEEGSRLCNFIKTEAELQNTSVGMLLSDDPNEKLNYDELISRDSGLGVADKSEAAGMAAPEEFILKSVFPQELLVRVQNLLRQRRYREEIQNAIGSLMTMAEGVEEQDKRASGHCKRLSTMAVELGAVVDCDEFQLTALERAGYLHDIGKISIPGALFEKIQPLSPREMELIREHCTLGERLCVGVAALRPVLPIIRHHHERANGSGYPDGLRGDEIPVLAQIFSIPDIYDALRMRRPFRPAMNEGQAVDVLRQEVMRGFWNRYIFDAFVKQVLPGLDDRLDAMHALWVPG